MSTGFSSGARQREKDVTIGNGAIRSAQRGLGVREIRERAPSPRAVFALPGCLHRFAGNHHGYKLYSPLRQ